MSLAAPTVQLSSGTRKILGYDDQALAHYLCSPLNRIQLQAVVFRIEETLELSAACFHPTAHFRLGGTTLLRVPPLVGRRFTRGDDSPGGDACVILTFGYWQSRFGGDPTAVG